MKNLHNLFNECVNEVRAAGIEPGKIVDISINYRATTRWGQCKKRYGLYSININHRILEDDTDVKAVKDTIIHEILHTCPNCWNHGREWQRLANIMNRKYGYEISRTGSCEDFGIDREEYAESHAKYRIVCTSCGNVYRKQRACKVTKHPEYFRCGKCGGSLRLA